MGVREDIDPGIIVGPTSGVTLHIENFKVNAAGSVASLGEDGRVYLSPCNHKMDGTGYIYKKYHT